MKVVFESNLIKYVYICLINSKFKLDNAEFQSGLDTNKANIKKNILFKVDKKYMGSWVWFWGFFWFSVLNR